MSIESATRKMHPQTCNLMSSGGGGFEAIISGDIQALLMACEADPITWAYLFSYFDMGCSYDRWEHVGWDVEKVGVMKIHDAPISTSVRFTRNYKKIHVSCSIDEFSRMLKAYIYSHFLNNTEGDMLKKIKKASAAADEISQGLAIYLSTNPSEMNRISKYFRPIKPDTFRRKYKRFAIKANKLLYSKLVDLVNQILFFYEEQEKY